MKYIELVDLVMLAVNGGEFSSEAAVQRPEVESYLPSACHALIRESVYRVRAHSRETAESPVLDPFYYTTLHLDVQEDTTRAAKYVELPGVIQSLPAKHALEAVFNTQKPNSSYCINYNPSMVSEALKDIMVQCWYETVGEASRIYFYGEPSDLCKVTVRAAMEISPLLGEARIPLPTDLEDPVIERCIAHFRGQRGMPADVTLNQKDVNAQ